MKSCREDSPQDPLAERGSQSLKDCYCWCLVEEERTLLDHMWGDCLSEGWAGTSVLIVHTDATQCCHVADTIPSPHLACLWSLLSLCHWYHATAVLVFLWASWHQWNCHRILAQLGKQSHSNATKSSYGILQGDWFDHVTCLH